MRPFCPIGHPVTLALVLPMRERHISSAEAKAQFRAVLDDVLHHGGRYVIERHGRGVAAIVGVDEVERLARQHRPESNTERIGALALVGLWHDVAVDTVEGLLTEIAEVITERTQDAPP